MKKNKNDITSNNPALKTFLVFFINSLSLFCLNPQLFMVAFFLSFPRFIAMREFRLETNDKDPYKTRFRADFTDGFRYFHKCGVGFFSDKAVAGCNVNPSNITLEETRTLRKWEVGRLAIGTDDRNPVNTTDCIAKIMDTMMRCILAEMNKSFNKEQHEFGKNFGIAIAVIVGVCIFVCMLCCLSSSIQSVYRRYFRGGEVNESSRLLVDESAEPQLSTVLASIREADQLRIVEKNVVKIDFTEKEPRPLKITKPLPKHKKTISDINIKNKFYYDLLDNLREKKITISPPDKYMCCITSFLMIKPVSYHQAEKEHKHIDFSMYYIRHSSVEGASQHMFTNTKIYSQPHSKELEHISYDFILEEEINEFIKMVEKFHERITALSEEELGQLVGKDVKFKEFNYEEIRKFLEPDSICYQYSS